MRKERNRRGLEYANLLKVSQKEMNFISDLNQQNTNLGANNLFAKYPRLQVITVTRGHGGAVIFIRDNIIDIPSFKIIPVDPTGAGDAFTAALLYKINNALIAMNEYSLTNLNDADFWLKTGQFASAAGAITASLPGALNSMPTKKQLMSFLNRQLPK